MSEQLVYISDYFLEDVVGGAELNDYELCKLLATDGHDIKRIHSQHVTESFLQKNKNSKIILSNFTLLKSSIKDDIANNFHYVIYEHDHKYVRSRNPNDYADYIVPAEKIINFSLYKNAATVFCQSNFHKTIVKNNLKINNIFNLSGNLWSDKSLNLMQDLSSRTKKDKCSILDSSTPHKNTRKAVFFCKSKNYDYDLISASVPDDFLSLLSSNKRLVFFPQTPETLSRVCVEARMMGVELIVSKNVGAVHEEWISLKGETLVSFMKNKKTEIKNKVVSVLYE